MLQMCFKISLALLAVVFAHIVSKFLPAQTHWKFQGKAMPNSSIVWTPTHLAPDGMVFIHLWGNGSIRYDQHNVPVNGHLFFHLEGNVPNIYYTSTDTAVKAHMHLIAGI